ncbi:MAG: hypothetical protein WA828_14795 [Coleofasciculaceae cyanobacterium]
MSKNLITSKIINPAKLPLEQVRQQVATLLKIALKQIECIECWQHQIWVKLVGTKAKLVSYRSLPLWLEQGLNAIKNCTSRTQLDELGEILKTERDWYEAHQQPEAVQPWRNAWSEQAQYLREEEERLQPYQAHQQAGSNWQKAWAQILDCCRNFTGLQSLALEIKQQSQDFADLPEVMQTMQQLWEQRSSELSLATG